jgi:hypothetical protein
MALETDVRELESHVASAEAVAELAAATTR